MQQKGADGHAVHQAVQGVVAALSQLDAFLADGGQRRGGIGAHGQVVEARDADVCGDAQSELLALDHDGVRQQVVAADDGRRALLQQAGKLLFQTLGDIIGASRERGIRLQAVLAHGVKKGGMAHLHDMGAKRAAQITDLPVSQRLQTGHGQFHPFIIVDSHISHTRIGHNIVVIQHGGRPGGLKVLHPRVA